MSAVAEHTLVIAAAIAAVIGIPAAFAVPFVYNHWWINRITVRRISSSGDEYLEPLLDLHSQLFRKEVTDRPSDIRRWLNEIEDLKPLNQWMADDFLLAAMKYKKLVGYVFATIYADSGYLFISYYGIDKSDDDARRLAAPMLMKYLHRNIRRKYPNWNGIVTELELDDAPYLGRRYRQYAQKFGYQSFQVDIPYFQPPITPGADFEKVPLVLAFIPSIKINLIEDKYLMKSLILSLLRFIYFQIYGDSFIYDPTRPTEYRVYRQQLLALYEAHELELPSKVAVGRLGVGVGKGS